MLVESREWVVLQAYGQKEIFLEARFLLLSACSQLMADAGCKVIIYTDNAAEVAGWGFPSEKVFTKTLMPEMITAWKGPQDFVHRLKIEMLRDAAASLNPEKMLYLDSDMVLKGNLDNILGRIEHGKAVMHEQEGKLSGRSNPILRKMHQFVKDNSFLINGKSIQVNEHTMMRNAGVIGLHRGHFPLLDDVLALTDAMYARYPKHVIEQLAFSSVLGNELQVHDARAEFLHYWYAKELRGWLEDFFAMHGDKPIEDQEIEAKKLGFEDVAASRLAWKNQPSLKRKLLKLTGKEWKLPPYPSNL